MIALVILPRLSKKKIKLKMIWMRLGKTICLTICLELWCAGYNGKKIVSVQSEFKSGHVCGGTTL